MISLLMLPAVALLAISILLVVLARRAQANTDAASPRKFLVPAMQVAAAVSAARVLIFWYLVYRQWTRTEDLSELYLIVFVFPELLLTRDTGLLSWSDVALSTILLVGGSAFMIAALALPVWIYLDRSGREKASVWRSS
jgi:hypothetical protein